MNITNFLDTIGNVLAQAVLHLPIFLLKSTTQKTLAAVGIVRECHPLSSLFLQCQPVSAKRLIASFPFLLPLCNSQSVSVCLQLYFFFVRKYTPIVSREQRSQYKDVFNAEYDEYRKLHANVDTVTKRFKELQKEIKAVKEGTEDYEVSVADSARPFTCIIFDFTHQTVIAHTSCSFLCNGDVQNTAQGGGPNSHARVKVIEYGKPSPPLHCLLGNPPSLHTALPWSTSWIMWDVTWSGRRTSDQVCLYTRVKRVRSLLCVPASVCRGLACIVPPRHSPNHTISIVFSEK